MEIEVKNQTDNEMVFIVRDVEVPFINAIRRYAMVNVPKIAIEDVNIIRNDSATWFRACIRSEPSPQKN